MSAGAQVDYEALAKKYGGAPAADYDAIAKKYGGSAIPLAPTGNAGTQEHPLVTPKPGEDFASTMRRGVEMGRQVTPEQIKTAKWEAIKDVPTVMSVAALPGLVTGLGEAATAGSMRAAMPSLLKMGRGLIGAGVGAGLGERAGSSIGGLFGDTGRQVGGVVGSVGGGIAGGGLAAGLERRTPTPLQAWRGQSGSIPPLPFNMQRLIPESLVPQTGELGAPTNPGPYNELPLKMRGNRGTAIPQLVGEVGGGMPQAPRPSPSEENITNIIRKRIVTPEEASAETRELGARAPRKAGEGLMEREARLLGETRARRASKGMKEPE